MTEQNSAITIEEYDVSPGWEQWYLLTSDNHFDSIYCNRALLKEHLEEAKRRLARVFVFGDWFDAMQGRYDNRRAMPELRPEYARKEHYYDFLVDDAANWLDPYGDLLRILADGNHELSVLKNANTDIMNRLVELLNSRHNTNVIHGGYGGWVLMRFNINTGITIKQKTIRLKYYHGSGGEAPVTRGSIQTNRQAVMFPDADIVVNGHSHNQYHIIITRERVTANGVHYMHNQHHVRIPGYKQAYGDGRTGWEVTRGGVPKPIGSMLLHLYCTSDFEIKVGIESLVDAPDIVSVDANDLYNGPIYNDDNEGE